MFCRDKAYFPDYSDTSKNGVKANSPKTPTAMAKPSERGLASYS
jgi:hypothetical protein